MFERTKAFADTFLKMGIPGFDLLICKNGEPLLRYSNGYSNAEEKTPIRGDERYWIYSCSKPITVTAMLQLWEKGLFQLEDPVSKYLPEYAHLTVQTPEGIVPATQPLTMWHLFTMTAGFSYDYRSPSMLALREKDPDPSMRQIAEALAKEPLLFEPGDQYRYCLGHDVLAIISEQLTGMPYEEYVKKNIFKPMGMERSTFRLQEEEYAGMAPLYRFNKETGTRMRLDRTPDRIGKNFVSGGGGCVTTVEDYMRFAEGLRTHKLLKPETVKMLTTPQLTKQQASTFRLKTCDYGLGMWIPRAGELRQDYGWGGAAGALLCVDESRGISLVYIQHMLSSPNQGLRGKMVRTFLEELEGLEPSVEIPDVSNYNLTY